MKGLPVFFFGGMVHVIHVVGSDPDNTPENLRFRFPSRVTCSCFDTFRHTRSCTSSVARGGGIHYALLLSSVPSAGAGVCSWGTAGTRAADRRIDILAARRSHPARPRPFPSHRRVCHFTLARSNRQRSPDQTGKIVCIRAHEDGVDA